MLSVLPDMLVAYKRVIDDGLGMTLAQGLQMERARSREWAGQVDADAIELRRNKIAQRGRDQKAAGTD